jgi:flagellar operon protein
MDDIRLNRFSIPITTGGVGLEPKQGQTKTKSPESQSFNQILQQQIQQNSSLAFSKHAVSRVVQRNIDVSHEQLSRLNEGVSLARQKGLAEPLILVDQTAFLVSIKNNTVITTVAGDELKGNVFTNIDGTVII